MNREPIKKKEKKKSVIVVAIQISKPFFTYIIFAFKFK